MKHFLAALAILISTPALAANWPTNIVTVSDTITSASCSGVDNPWSCCDGGTGCNGIGGEDIADGLETCDDTSGCILQLPCGTVPRVGIDVGASGADETKGRDGTGYPEWTNGLIVRGCGMNNTILKSSVPLGFDPAKAAGAIFWIFSGTNEGCGLGSHCRFEDFSMDGQSGSQPAPSDGSGNYGTAAGVYGTVGSTAGHHVGILARCDAAICGEIQVDRVEAHHFIGGGIRFVSHNPTTIINSNVHHIGCWQNFGNSLCTDNDVPGLLSGSPPNRSWGSHTDYTCCGGAGTGTCDSVWKAQNGTGQAVVGELQCGCTSGTSGSPDYCEGWELEAEANSQTTASPGVKSFGFGITTEGWGRHNMLHNTCSFTNKYCLDASWDGGSGAEPTIAPGNFTIMANNRVSDSTIALQLGNFYSHGWIRDNVITSNGLDGGLPYGMHAIGDAATGGLTKITGNTIAGSVGSAISLQSYAQSDEAPNPRIIVTGNNINGNCLWADTDPSVNPAVSTIFKRVGHAPTCSNPNFKSGVTISNNVIASDNTCVQTISIEDEGQQCASNFADPLVMSNNDLYPSSWASHNTAIARVTGYNITSLANILRTLGPTGVWTWLSGSTGTCSGWTKNGQTVTDSSGNGIGSC